MSLFLKISASVVLIAWMVFLLLVEVPEYSQAGPNLNISTCHFCDADVDFSVRNLVCCSLTSRCCGPDRI